MVAKDDVDVSVDNKTGQQQPSEDGAPKRAAQNERQAVWGDYFRVFTYAKKWDFVLMFGAAVASLAAGVVSPTRSNGHTCSVPLKLKSTADHASHECHIRPTGW